MHVNLNIRLQGASFELFLWPEPVAVRLLITPEGISGSNPSAQLLSIKLIVLIRAHDAK